MCPADDGLFFNTVSHTPSARLIHRYEAIATASRCMLIAARRDDWQEVARLEQCCRELIERLRTAADEEHLDEVDQRTRVRLLRAILADDAEIRARAEPWLLQLEQLIGRRAARTAGRD